MTTIPLTTYREKVLGCWLGKAVGGTLGGPYEGQDGPLSLSYYDPVPGRMLPNDDLDLQVVWLETIRRHGLPIERRTLATAWLDHVHLWPDEYGVASRNLTRGLYPPVSGRYDNGFTAGMGAAIRTELWACLAPGDPGLAATLAREDAVVDHADEGVYAAQFLAALESAAFVEHEREALLDLAADVIPPDCRVSRAVADTRRWWAENKGAQSRQHAGQKWHHVRSQILAHHGRQNFTDVAQNLAFIVLGWLAGEGDFDAAICIAVNCGKDTDCTGATLGALLGILNPRAIDKKWLKPIGRDLVLSPGMVGLHPPITLDELTDQVTSLAAQVQAYYGSDVTLSAPVSADQSLSPPRHPNPDGMMLSSSASSTESLVATEPLIVYLTYPLGVALPPGQPSEIGVRVFNSAQHELTVTLRARAPDGWGLTASAQQLHLAPGAGEALSYSVTPPAAEVSRAYLNPLDLTFQTAGAGGLRWTVTAGLVTTIPWRRWKLAGEAETCPEMPLDAETFEAPGHFQPLPLGPCALAAEFKAPYHKTLRVIVQAPRPLRAWLDGQQLVRHDGHYQVPAIHRARDTGADVALRRGWHRLTVAVGDGDEGDLFVGLGDGESWDWLRNAEWRLPVN